MVQPYRHWGQTVFFQILNFKTFDYCCEAFQHKNPLPHVLDTHGKGIQYHTWSVSAIENNGALTCILWVACRKWASDRPETWIRAAEESTHSKQEWIFNRGTKNKEYYWNISTGIRIRIQSFWYSEKFKMSSFSNFVKFFSILQR